MCFSRVGNYLRPSNNYRQVFQHKCCCFDTDNLFRFTILVKCIPKFYFFTVFLKNRNISSKIKRSKVTDYASLKNNSSNSIGLTFNAGLLLSSAEFSFEIIIH